MNFKRVPNVVEDGRPLPLGLREPQQAWSDNPRPTLSQALGEGARLLTAVSAEAPIEAELLLMHALELTRERLYQQLREPLPEIQQQSYRRLLERRLARE